MTSKKSFARYVPMIAGAVIVLIVTGFLVVWIRGLMQDKPESPKRQVAQVIKIVRPPPPPPEPPPPPPPEEKVEEPLPQETPEEAPPDDAAPAEQLGIDADGVAGADGFGLAARRGGSDLIGGGGAVFAWYTNRLKDSIQSLLADDERVRRGKYQVSVRVWVSQDGRVEKIRLQSTSGDRDLDGAIEEALQKMSRMDEAPPLEMPQPVTLRIVSR
ncbi:protein TonB [Povalibacter uvarum]|uniref:Protein TonB n=1 Tax=Povalibacter uvarum TaxID=732238 RepID=A0A841HG07_9GAMM|nr:TonB family protein [Povalibacter uvarum]MBB6091238.1 protein TonB [Povalibacter uvarum]